MAERIGPRDKISEKNDAPSRIKIEKAVDPIGIIVDLLKFIGQVSADKRMLQMDCWRA